jgi:hypothetical protein
VITESVKLDSDVVCPHDFGSAALVIGADDITLDLHGFSVVGPAELDSRAIETDRPRRRVAIRNGTVGSRTEVGSYISARLSQSTVRNVRTAGSGGVTIIGDRNMVVANAVHGAAFSGIQVFGDENRVVDNDVRAAEGWGIAATGHGFQIDRNTVTLSKTYGFHDGIAVWAFDDIQIRRNIVSTTSSEGIQVGQGVGALVDRNITFENRVGISVGSLASEIVLSRNQANNNSTTYDDSGSGIQVNSASTLIKQNTANNNLDYGIWAVPGVVDGGGNSASGNGIADCVNVSCN